MRSCGSVLQFAWSRFLLACLVAVAQFCILCVSQETAKGVSGSFEALAQSAATAREQGHGAEAIRDYRAALAIRPDWAEGWWYLGSLQYEGDEYSDAVQSFQKLTALAPQSGAAWSFLGLCEFETKNYADSLTNLEKGQELGGLDDPEILRVSAYHLALLRIHSGQFTEATELLASSFARGQLSAQVKFALGLAMLQLAVLPGEVDPSQEGLVQTAGEAAAYAAEGEASRSLQTLKALVKEYPDIPAAHRAYAKALNDAGQSSEADAELHIADKLAVQHSATRSENPAGKSGRSSSSSAAEIWNQAMADYSSGKYPAAIAELKSYLVQKPQDGTGWAVLGLSEFSLRDYDNALIHLRRGQALGFGGSPESVQQANYALGILLNRGGEFKSATEVLASVSGRGPLKLDVQRAMGMSLLHMQQLPDQISSPKRGLTEAAGEIAILLQQSKYDEAFSDFQVLLKRYPGTPFLHYSYGVALASLSQFDDAAAQMREEIKISPKTELPYVRLASIALRQHRPSDALDPARQAVRLAPESGEAHYLLGRAYLELGQTQDALHELEVASKLSPDSPEVHFNLAKAYAKANLVEQAEQERAIFVRLNTIAEQQRSTHGDQSYAGPRDSAEVSVSDANTTTPPR